jgi:uncharacterized membrane protein YesL
MRSNERDDKKDQKSQQGSTVHRVFSLNGRLYRFLDKCWQLLIANFLFIAGALPVISLVTSCITLYDSVRAIEEDEFRPQHFWRIWKKYFRVGVELFVIFLLVFLCVAVPVILLAKMHISVLWDLPFMVIFAILLLTMPVACALAAWENDDSDDDGPHVFVIIRTAFLLAMSNVGFAICAALAPLVIGALVVFFWRLLPIWCCFAFSLAAWMQYLPLMHMLGLRRPMTSHMTMDE